MYHRFTWEKAQVQVSSSGAGLSAYPCESRGRSLQGE